jgi:hypothetical protein
VSGLSGSGLGILCLLRINGAAFFPDDSYSAKDMVAVTNLEYLPDLFWDRYAPPSDDFCEERYLFFVNLNWHSFRHRGYFTPEKVLTFLICQNQLLVALATTNGP